jgi:hypothetical protein
LEKQNILRDEKTKNRHEWQNILQNDWKYVTYVTWNEVSLSDPSRTEDGGWGGAT